MHLIFDFDGTLVDSFDCVINKFILLADEFNFRKVDPQETEQLRDLSSKELIKHLQIPLYKIPMIIYKIRKLLNNEIKTLPPFPNLYSVLKTLYHAGLPLGILTSNSADNVNTWLKHNAMQDFFSFVCTESNYFSKKRLLKRLLNQYKIDKTQACYIGDETRDIDAANQNNIKSIAVTWGYNSERALMRSQPSHIIRKPDDLLSLCQIP